MLWPLVLFRFGLTGDRMDGVMGQHVHRRGTSRDLLDRRAASSNWPTRASPLSNLGPNAALVPHRLRRPEAALRFEHGHQRRSRITRPGAILTKRTITTGAPPPSLGCICSARLKMKFLAPKHRLRRHFDAASLSMSVKFATVQRRDHCSGCGFPGRQRRVHSLLVKEGASPCPPRRGRADPRGPLRGWSLSNLDQGELP